MEMATDILTEVAAAGNHSLTLVANKGNKLIEKAVHVGTDNDLTMYLFLSERMVKLVKRKAKKTVVSSYKEALLSENVKRSECLTPRGSQSRTPSHWIHEEVTGHDLVGLTWILKMHADESITRLESMTTPTEGEISWTRDKFSAINKKGKCDMLKYLAVRTGCELTISNLNGKPKTAIKGRVEGAKIKYDTLRDLVTISVENNNAHSKPTSRAPSVMSGAELTCDDDDTTWVKSLGVRRIIHKSTDCNRLRRICRRSTSDTYPPHRWMLRTSLSTSGALWRSSQATSLELRMVYTSGAS
jgi:hypothetical protein